MERRIFSTDCSVKALQPYHAPLKQLVVTLAGFQSSNTPAGKVVRAELFNQASLKLAPAFMLHAPNETKAEFAPHALVKLVPLERSKAGKEVSAEQ